MRLRRAGLPATDVARLHGREPGCRGARVPAPRAPLRHRARPARRRPGRADEERAMSDAGTALRGRDVQVARKVNGERVTLLGWGTAILMQFAHPLVAAGVAEHSTVFSDTRAWIRRFHATIAS